MKKKLQKYLSGSNEGFSLVELIIVIAIMAILVGVVALAVIPNLERSRESKDLTTLDNIASALATSVATAGADAPASGEFKITEITGAAGSLDDSVKNNMLENLGDCKDVKLGSGAGKGKDINCKYDTTANTLSVVAGDGNVQCKYQKDDNGTLRTLAVVK